MSGRLGGATATAPALRFTQLSVLRNGRSLLDRVDWQVDQGDRWVLLGPNGSGKTTLLEVAGARLLPSRGTAEVLGEQLGRVDMRALRGRVAFVSGALARQLRPTLTAREVVVTGRDGALDPRWRTVPDEDWLVADQRLARHAPGIATRQFGVLSEGERQQVLLARALAGSAQLVLLDEPAAGLDLGARERLVTAIGRLAADPAVPALVLVTHHVEEIPPGFTDVALLRGGRMLCAEAVGLVLTSEAVSECFETRVRVGHRDGRWWATSEG